MNVAERGDRDNRVINANTAKGVSEYDCGEVANRIYSALVEEKVRKAVVGEEIGENENR